MVLSRGKEMKFWLTITLFILLFGLISWMCYLAWDEEAPNLVVILITLAGSVLWFGAELVIKKIKKH